MFSFLYLIVIFRCSHYLIFVAKTPIYLGSERLSSWSKSAEQNSNSQLLGCAFSSVNNYFLAMYVCMVACLVASVMSNSATLWALAPQASPSMEVFRKENWSGLLCPPPGDLPRPGIKPASLKSPALAGEFSTTSVTWEAT